MCDRWKWRRLSDEAREDQWGCHCYGCTVKKMSHDNVWEWPLDNVCFTCMAESRQRILYYYVDETLISLNHPRSNAVIARSEQALLILSMQPLLLRPLLGRFPISITVSTRRSSLIRAALTTRIHQLLKIENRSSLYNWIRKIDSYSGSALVGGHGQDAILAYCWPADVCCRQPHHSCVMGKIIPERLCGTAHRRPCCNSLRPGRVTNACHQ